MRFLQHVVTSPEAQAISRTRLYAGRHSNCFAISLALSLAERFIVAGYRERLIGSVCAVRTFLYLRSEGIPLCGWYSPRTRPHAVTATDALGRIVSNWSVRLTRQGCRGTGRGTRWLEAVQAPTHAKDVIQSSGRIVVRQLMKGDQSKSFCT